MNAMPPALQLREESAVALDGHASIPSVFTAHAICSVHAAPTGRTLRERPVPAFTKDDDACEDPRRWPHDFDTRAWALPAAYDGAVRVGAARVAVATPGVDMLEGRDDLAVLRDLRVAPAWRGRGLAMASVDATQAWARRAGCSERKVETRNNNPAACRLDARAGLRLVEARPGAYPELPDEMQLIWRMRLAD
jgi:GNAT superfamily N-acetyltransferase